MPVYTRKENRRGIRFTMLIAGASGTGKTSFVNSLLDENVMDHKFEVSGKSNTKLVTFLNPNNSHNAIDLESKFDPSNAIVEPGIAITETTVEIIDDDSSKILLTIIDTPGFGENLDNNICIEEICNFLEQQFDYVLAEETKVRRNPRFEDTRVHVCVYFIEPTGHGLKELDVESMMRISKYCNVIPVISRADSFTELELKNFKRNINMDIEKYKIPVYQFQYDENDFQNEDDNQFLEEVKYLSSLQPFAIITSDHTEIIDGKSTRVRNYPWGKVDINNTQYSDFPILKNVILGSQLQDLKDITHDYLYEAYRTEKLSSVIDFKDSYSRRGSTINNSATLSSFASEPPSMSNLAEIANSKSMAKFDIPKKLGDNDTDAEVGSLNASLKNTTIAEEAEDDSGNQADSFDTRRKSMDSTMSQSTFNKPLLPASSNNNSPQLSLGSNSSFIHQQQSNIDAKKLRKISETVPYIIRQETIRSKQAKLQELEKQSALELSKRALELEQKAMELKLREQQLKERWASLNKSNHTINSSQTDAEKERERERERDDDVQSEFADTVEE